MARHIGRAAAAVALLGGARALRYHSNQHHGAGSMVPASPPPPLLTRRLRGGAEFLSSASLLAHNPEMAKTLVSSKLVSKTRMYGFVVLALGLVLSTLGFMLFFNRTLIGTGNLLTIGGVVLIVGHQRAYAFLAQRERARGSGIFLFGVFLVLRGSARLGVLVRGAPASWPGPARTLAACQAVLTALGGGGRWSSLGSSTCLAILSPRCLAWSRASRSLGPRSRHCSSPRPRPGLSTSSPSERFFCRSRWKGATRAEFLESRVCEARAIALHRHQQHRSVGRRHRHYRRHLRCLPTVPHCQRARARARAVTRRGCWHAREPSSHISRAQILGTEQDS